jgi:Putative Ig domain
MKKFLPAILGFILALTPVSSYAAVTWAAQGLPPGLSINASTGAITGKPTQAGNYTVIIYPKNGSAVGNMNSIKITVLPAGVNLPTYYAYSRLTSSGDYLGSTIAGGGGYIWGIDQILSIPEVTTNGVAFSEPSLPPNITQAFQYDQTTFAVCGNKALYLGADSRNSVHCLLSTRAGAFYDVGMPAVGQTMSPLNVSLATDGTKNFYMILSYYDLNSGNSLTSIWKSPAQSISWSQIGTNASTYQSASSISVAVSGNTNIVCFSDGSGFLISADGGVSFSNNTSNAQITCISYGNGKFLGTGSSGTGVWSSTDGQYWTQISSVDPGNIMYSSYEKLFFSNNGGVSADGVYWQPYQNYPNYYSESVASSGTGLVFLGGSQLSTNNIPNGASGTFQTSVGKSTTITAAH